MISMFWSLTKTVKDVKDMYEYAKENNLPLLSDFESSELTSDFWDDYKDNFADYDKVFYRMFKSYRYFNQEVDEDNPIADVTADFIDAVYGHLMMNDKKYSMLYKAHTATTTDMNPYYDYYMTHSSEGGRTVEGEYVSGTRTDESENVSGQRTDTTTNQVMAYNSSTFVDESKSTYVKGAETDTNEYSKGQQTDTNNVEETNSVESTTKGIRNNPTKNMEQYRKVWTYYEFYLYIFKEIAKDLLLI